MRWGLLTCLLILLLICAIICLIICVIIYYKVFDYLQCAFIYRYLLSFDYLQYAIIEQVLIISGVEMPEPGFSRFMHWNLLKPGSSRYIYHIY
jgi:hypothetical protein